MGSVSNLTWRLKRSGTGTSTEYVGISLGQDKEAFDLSKYELFQLEKVAVKEIPYEEQEKFYMVGESEEQSSDSSSSNVEW